MTIMSLLDYDNCDGNSSWLEYEWENLHQNVNQDMEQIDLLVSDLGSLRVSAVGVSAVGGAGVGGAVGGVSGGAGFVNDVSNEMSIQTELTVYYALVALWFSVRTFQNYYRWNLWNLPRITYPQKLA